jgi:hypothetical protein
MKDSLWPAKRQRNERMRAAVQQSTGTRAVRRILGGCVCVCDLMSVGSALGGSEEAGVWSSFQVFQAWVYVEKYISHSRQSLKPNSNRNNKKKPLSRHNTLHPATPYIPTTTHPHRPHSKPARSPLLPSPAGPAQFQPSHPDRRNAHRHHSRHPPPACAGSQTRRRPRLASTRGRARRPIGQRSLGDVDVVGARPHCVISATPATSERRPQGSWVRCGGAAR